MSLKSKQRYVLNHGIMCGTLIELYKSIKEDPILEVFVGRYLIGMIQMNIGIYLSFPALAEERCEVLVKTIQNSCPEIYVPMLKKCV